MKVLVIGSGGREHAICVALNKSKKVDKIFAAPGNAGIEQIAQCIAIGEKQIDNLLDFAKNEQIDLTIVGPEISLTLGIVDVFKQNGLNIFGPTQKATQIESSKEFAKRLMKKHNIPTAKYELFTNYDTALSYVIQQGAPIVIKYNGLAAGKGVVVAMSVEEAEKALKEMLMEKKFGEGSVIIEEFLQGVEFSFMCFVNGESIYPMALAQDHKRAFEDDKGPNTGGMGAYSPLSFISNDEKEFAFENIMKKTAKALMLEGVAFCGVLYGGLMKTDEGIKVIEFNARFGDPETEVVLPRMKGDIFDIFNDIIEGRTPKIEWDSRYAIGFVLASKGYPNEYEKGIEIRNLDALNDVEIYQMGTKKVDGKIITDGGRVIFITALDSSIQEAKKKAIREIEKIQCENLFYRRDIAKQEIENSAPAKHQ